MKLSIKTEVELFSAAQLEQLLQKALHVLRQSVFRVQGTDEFFDLVRAFGCEVDGESLRFPPRVIERVVARCAEEKTKALAESQSSPTDAEVTMFTHGQALHICDLESNELRPALEADLAQWCHAVDELGIPERMHPTFIPTDVQVGAADFHAFATIILNSRRPHPVSVYSARMLPFFVEACRIAKGSLEAVKREPVFVTKAWVASPFMLDRENVEIAMDARRLVGAPLTFGHMPVVAASTPVTIAGALVQNTAESLALSAIRLAVDNLPQPIGGSSAVIDMSSGFCRQFGPDYLLHRVAGQEMDEYLYGGRRAVSAWGWCGCGAATVSMQAVAERALGMAFGAAMGARAFGVGSLAFSDVGSPVQLLIDRELVGYVQQLLRDVSIDEERIGMEAILSTIPSGGRYLESSHTADYFRQECWLPQLFDYRAFHVWARDSADLIAKARGKARELYQRACNHCPLDDNSQRALRGLLREADAVAARASGNRPAVHAAAV
jgi:trimethylamine--corrinoid protein Co-methyltransferase